MFILQFSVLCAFVCRTFLNLASTGPRSLEHIGTVSEKPKNLICCFMWFHVVSMDLNRFSLFDVKVECF